MYSPGWLWPDLANWAFTGSPPLEFRTGQQQRYGIPARPRSADRVPCLWLEQWTERGIRDIDDIAGGDAAGETAGPSIWRSIASGAVVGRARPGSR
jgi:hypothetical protein